jgi:hypothetical protein
LQVCQLKPAAADMPVGGQQLGVVQFFPETEYLAIETCVNFTGNELLFVGPFKMFCPKLKYQVFFVRKCKL